MWNFASEISSIVTLAFSLVVVTKLVTIYYAKTSLSTIQIRQLLKHYAKC